MKMLELKNRVNGKKQTGFFERRSMYGDVYSFEIKGKEVEIFESKISKNKDKAFFLVSTDCLNNYVYDQII